MEAQPHTLEAYMAMYYPTLLGIAKNKLGTYLNNDWRDPEDVVLETFRIFARKLERGEVDLEQNVGGLLYTILKCQCVNFMAGLRKPVELKLDAPLPGTTHVTGVEISIDDNPHNNPEQMALSKELLKEKKDAIQACVNILSGVLREAVILVCLQKWKYKEAADELKIPVGTVKSRVNMAKKKLKDCLERKGVIK